MPREASPILDLFPTGCRSFPNDFSRPCGGRATLSGHASGKPQRMLRRLACGGRQTILQ
jgi:hypothetical protein